MKNNIIRASVLLLAVAGFGASTVAAKSTKATFAANNVVPIPTCAPSDPTYCGLQ